MNISERIAEQQKHRQSKAESMQALLDTTEKDGRALNDDERKSFDEIEGSIQDIDETLTRLRKHESIMARGASPVIEVRDPKVDAGPGIRFARLCQLIVASKGNPMQAQMMAQAQWPNDRDIQNVVNAHARGLTLTRAAVAAATTTDAAWAGALVSAETLAGEFLNLVMKEAVIGQLTQVRRVPFNVRIPREVTALGTVKWVGQGVSKPLGKGAYDFVTVPWAKVALIVVITEELARFSNPAAETLMRDQLVRAIKEFLDDQFVNSAVAPVLNVQPGGITNGLAGSQTFPSAGNSPAQIQSDITTALSKLHEFNAPVAPVWIMHPQNLIAIAGMQNALGQPAFPTLANKQLAGYPVITSSHLLVSEIILLDQAGVLLAMDPAVTVDVSREASVQMDDAPATPATPLVSFWQQNLIGLKGEMFAYWMRARDKDVVLITAVDYLAPPAAAGAALAAPAAPRAPSPKQSAS